MKNKRVAAMNISDKGNGIVLIGKESNVLSYSKLSSSIILP